MKDSGVSESVINCIHDSHHLSNDNLIIQYYWLLSDLTLANTDSTMSWGWKWGKSLLVAKCAYICQYHVTKGISFQIQSFDTDSNILGQI